MGFRSEAGSASTQHVTTIVLPIPTCAREGNQANQAIKQSGNHAGRGGGRKDGMGLVRCGGFEMGSVE